VTVGDIFGDYLDSDELPPTPFSLLVNGGPDDDGFSLDLEDVPRWPGVYVFATTKPFGRLHGASNILYIGRSGESARGNLRARLTEYVRVTRKVRRTPKKGAELKIAMLLRRASRHHARMVDVRVRRGCLGTRERTTQAIRRRSRRDAAVQQPTRSYPLDRPVNSGWGCAGRRGHGQVDHYRCGRARNRFDVGRVVVSARAFSSPPGPIS
jgi:hypothetical protein